MLKAAWLMDTVGNKVAKKEIAMIKVVAPNVACKVIDWAIQAYGGAGVNDAFLVDAYASARSLRLADGPDEVHRNAIAKLELRELAGAAAAVADKPPRGLLSGSAGERETAAAIGAEPDARGKQTFSTT